MCCQIVDIGSIRNSFFLLFKQAGLKKNGFLKNETNTNYYQIVLQIKHMVSQERKNNKGHHYYQLTLLCPGKSIFKVNAKL